MEKIEECTKCLLDNSTLSTRFKLPIRGGTNNVGKDPRGLTNSRLMMKSLLLKFSMPHNFLTSPPPWFFFLSPFLLFIYFISSPLLPLLFLVNIILQSSLGDLVLQIRGTLKSMMNPEGYNAVLIYSENSKTPISTTIELAHPLVIKGSPQQVKGKKPIAAYEISHFCADNLISDLRQHSTITLWENLRQKIIHTPLGQVTSLEPELRKIFDAIVTSGNNNLTILRELVDGYLQGVENHNRIPSLYLFQLTKDAQLTEAKGFVKTLQLNENRILAETNNVKHHLTQLSAKEVKLEAKLMVVRTDSAKLSDIIFKNDIELKWK